MRPAGAVALWAGAALALVVFGTRAAAQEPRPTLPSTRPGIVEGRSHPAVSDLRRPELTEQVEADWLMQAKARMGRLKPAEPPPVATHEDAAGAVDGVKNGLYAFHTGLQTNPWWQVDLGASAEIARVVVYNRLDYAPGLHNADTLRILTSDDGKTWVTRHDQGGRFFGGIKEGGPLVVEFKAGTMKARFVRLQIPSEKPIFFHLDEVEVYGPGRDANNLALNRPADQSSISTWSKSKLKAPVPTTLPGDERISLEVIAEVLERGRKTAADLGQSGRRLDEIENELKKLAADASADARQELYLRARWAVRAIVMSNPLLDFDRLLFYKRLTQETYPDVCLNHMPWVSRPGGDLCILEKSGGLYTITHLLNGALGLGHVRGMDLWYEGDRIVFGYAMARSQTPVAGFPGRLGHDKRLSEEPIHIFEVRTDGSALRQVTDSRHWSDLDPTYAPNGDVVFVSDRCGFSLQCNEYDKDETSCNLYAVRPDGSGMRRLSVNKDGDYLPHALDDGSIAYTRWEYHERGFSDLQSIWTIRPDGTMADALFKQHLANPWALEDTRSIPLSRKLVSIATGHHTLAVGPVCVIDPSAGMNDSAGIRIVTPGVRPPEGGMSGTPVAQGGVFDAVGYYATPWPLSEKYFLVSYNYGKQTDTSGYGLYLIDVFGNKELIYREKAISCWAPIPLRPRPRPPVIPESADPTVDYAVCTITNVGYGTDVPAERIKYVRVAVPVGWPYDPRHGGWRYEDDAKSAGVGWNPTTILGTVAVEADGSACFKVPADTAVYFQLLDDDQMEIRRMRSFISFQRGEQRSCNGCHETRAQAFPADRLERRRRTPVTLTPPPWGTTPISFLREVQPILDEHCARCHRGLKPAGGLDFSGGLTAKYNRAYETIVKKKLVALSDKYDSSAVITQPYAFGSHKSKLVQCLKDENHAHAVKLSREQFTTLVTWVDANAPYHDGFIDKRPEQAPYDIAADKKLFAQIEAVHARRCISCHTPAQVTRIDWIDLRQPRRSLFLAAPLSKSAGGTGACGESVYADSTDADWRALSTQVEAAVGRALAQPRRDVKAIAPAGSAQSGAADRR